MKKFIFLMSFVLIINSISAQNKNITVYHTGGTKTIVDIANIDSMVIFICGASKVNYGGKAYNTVLIGDQCWLKENLDVGTQINGNQDQTNNSIIEKYCYGDEPSYCTTYGGLYQWNEAMQFLTTEGVQGVCPTGWHLPTLAEFQTLSTTVAGDGNALKAVGQGSGSGAGTNTSGFSALLAGFRNFDGNFNHVISYAYFWTSTENSENIDYGLWLRWSNSDISWLFFDYRNGQSVRCLKD